MRDMSVLERLQRCRPALAEASPCPLPTSLTGEADTSDGTSIAECGDAADIARALPRRFPSQRRGRAPLAGAAHGPVGRVCACAQADRNLQ